MDSTEAHRPSVVSPAAGLESAWAVAGRVAERELAPDGYFVIGRDAVEILHSEALAAGYPLVAALIADCEVFRGGDPEHRAERPPVLSPWEDRFLSVEASCRAAISIEIERLVDAPNASELAALARTQGRPELAELLAEGLEPFTPSPGFSLDH